MAIHAWRLEFVRIDKRGTRWYRCGRCGATFSEQHPTSYGEPCKPASESLREPERVCADQQPQSVSESASWIPGYLCSLPSGHDGPHQAYVDGELRAGWPASSGEPEDGA